MTSWEKLALVEDVLRRQLDTAIKLTKSQVVGQSLSFFSSLQAHQLHSDGPAILIG